MSHDADLLPSQLLNEIMPMIYKRFTEKSAEEWRQIYKGLQLLEFLIKHGSERVIDDARQHLSLLKMLRQFHYIDQNGKDQGINVRNRSKELCELLSDVDRIRTERKKARASKSKYSGVEGGAGAGLGMGGSSSRFGGFGSETGGHGASFGGASRTVYGDGGGFGGEGQDEYDEGPRNNRSERFEEYDEYDDGGAQAPAHRRKPSANTAPKKAPSKAEAPKPKEPEVDLFDFGDEPATISSAATLPAFTPAPRTSATLVSNEDDDFDDFQSATPAPSATTIASPPTIAPTIAKPNYSSFSTQYVQPSPQPGTQKADFSSLLATRSPPQAASPGVLTPGAAQSGPTGYQPTGPNYFTSVQAAGTQQAAFGASTPGSTIGTTQSKKSAGGDAFANLLAGSGMKKTNTATPKGLTIADMAKQKSHAGLYGANAPAAMSVPASNGAKRNAGGNSGLDDLLG